MFWSVLWLPRPVDGRSGGAGILVPARIGLCWGWREAPGHAFARAV